MSPSPPPSQHLTPLSPNQHTPPPIRRKMHGINMSMATTHPSRIRLHQPPRNRYKRRIRRRPKVNHQRHLPKVNHQRHLPKVNHQRHLPRVNHQRHLPRFNRQQLPEPVICQNTSLDDPLFLFMYFIQGI